MIKCCEKNHKFYSFCQRTLTKQCNYKQHVEVFEKHHPAAAVHKNKKTNNSKHVSNF